LSDFSVYTVSELVHDYVANNTVLQIHEAQLKQRDRATLRVIEYFAESLKFTHGHSKWHYCVGRV